MFNRLLPFYTLGTHLLCLVTFLVAWLAAWGWLLLMAIITLFGPESWRKVPLLSSDMADLVSMPMSCVMRYTEPKSKNPGQQ